MILDHEESLCGEYVRMRGFEPPSPKRAPDSESGVYTIPPHTQRGNSDHMSTATRELRHSRYLLPDLATPIYVFLKPVEVDPVSCCLAGL